MSDNNIVTIKNLSYTYAGNEKAAIEDISMQVREGEFVVLCGPTGCGKSSLLKLLKKELWGGGKRTGQILFDGTELEKIPDIQAACDIGLVMQSPDSQIVSDTVYGELAFGLENLGFPVDVIKRRIAEMSVFFGMGTWINQKVENLSGGQKQLLNLASVLAMHPRLLLLDEPTSQLDPVASKEFIEMILRLNSELFITVILVEQKLEDLFGLADRVALMDNGRLIKYDTPSNVGNSFKGNKQGRYYGFLPSPIRIFAEVDSRDECPVTIRQGREWLEKNLKDKPYPELAQPVRVKPDSPPTVECKNVYFAYDKTSQPVLKDLSFKAYPGEAFCILGGNGSGKSTLLTVLAGINKPRFGKIRINKKDITEYKNNSLYTNNVSYLPQNPRSIFFHDTVREELESSAKLYNYEDPVSAARQQAEQLNLIRFYDRHPYDLSGGEMQCLAIARVLLSNPKILLMDEPTKGLDSEYRNIFGELLKELKSKGITIIMVTHDVEFAARNADLCSLMFDGSLSEPAVPGEFFGNNYFYSTAANRMVRRISPLAITSEDVVKLCLE